MTTKNWSLGTRLAPVIGLLCLAACGEDGENAFISATVRLVAESPAASADGGSADGGAPAGPEATITLTSVSGGGAEVAEVITASLATEGGEVVFTDTSPATVNGEEGVLRPGSYRVEISNLTAGWEVVRGATEMEVADSEETETEITVRRVCDGSLEDCNGDGVIDALEPGGTHDPEKRFGALAVSCHEDGDLEAAVECTVEVQGDGRSDTWTADENGEVAIGGLPLGKPLIVVARATGFEKASGTVTLTGTDAEPFSLPMVPAGEVLWTNALLPCNAGDAGVVDVFSVQYNGAAVPAANLEYTSLATAIAVAAGKTADGHLVYDCVAAGTGSFTVRVIDADVTSAAATLEVRAP